MKFIVFLLLPALNSLVFYSCDNAANNNVPADRNIPDSGRLIVDSLNGKQDTGFIQVDLKQVLEDYRKECSDTIRVDTTVIYNDGQLNIHFRHYCKRDSSMEYPAEFIQPYGLKEFKASNFVSRLEIKAGGKLLIDTMIEKSFFKAYVGPEQALYGTLFYAGIHFGKDAMVVDYSYSIALTDLGNLVSARYNYGGKLQSEGTH